MICLACLASPAPCCALALLGTPASALATQIEVDEIIGQALLSNSGDETELAKLRTLAGLDNLVLGSKVDVSRKTPVGLAQDQPSTWFINDPTEPGYVALKFDTGNGAVADTFFFKNVGEMHLPVWSNDLVLSLTDWVCNKNDATKCHVERLSHYITSAAVQPRAKDPDQKESGGDGRRPGGELETGNQEGGGQDSVGCRNRTTWRCWPWARWPSTAAGAAPAEVL